MRSSEGEHSPQTERVKGGTHRGNVDVLAADCDQIEGHRVVVYPRLPKQRRVNHFVRAFKVHVSCLHAHRQRGLESLEPCAEVCCFQGSMHTISRDKLQHHRPMWIRISSSQHLLLTACFAQCCLNCDTRALPAQHL